MKCSEDCSNYAYDTSIYKTPWCLGNNEDVFEGMECFFTRKIEHCKNCDGIPIWKEGLCNDCYDTKEERELIEKIRK